jgi:ABC-type glutathione transport system ATPase component
MRSSHAGVLGKNAGAVAHNTHSFDPMLLSAKKLTKYFERGRSPFTFASQQVAALREVSFEIQKGEILGVVGESGCGKTTLARLLAGLIRPSSGEILFSDEIVSRSRDIQMVFQNPADSMDPRMSIRETLQEPLQVNRVPDPRRKIGAALEQVGLSSDCLSRLPHQFSGGQRQKLALARAVAPQPRLLLCDEPTSALDVSQQAQILNLLVDLNGKMGMTILFISHNLAVVRIISHRILVMLNGIIIEEGEAQEIGAHPRHPYTRFLMEHSLRTPGPFDNERSRCAEGCPFYVGCPRKNPACLKTLPAPIEVGPRHRMRCLYPC